MRAIEFVSGLVFIGLCVSVTLAGPAPSCYQTVDDGKCGADLVGPVIYCDEGEGISERRVSAEKRKCKLSCGQGMTTCYQTMEEEDYVCEHLTIWKCVGTFGNTVYTQTYDGDGQCCPTHLLSGSNCEGNEGCPE